MKRVGKVLKLRPECLEEYKKYHANIWPELVEGMHKRGIHNYSIYYRDGYLFSYFEITDDQEEVQEKRREPAEKDEKLSQLGQEWQRIMTAMQEPVDTAGPDEWWVDMEEVFHMD